MLFCEDFPVNDNGLPSERDSKPGDLPDDSKLGMILPSPDDPVFHESGAADPYRSAAPVHQPPDAMGSLSGNEIVAATLWVVFCVAVLFYLPGVGITLLIFSLPALVRTAIVLARRRHGGEEFSPGQKIGIFFGSAALIWFVVSVVGVCVSVGVFAGCLAGIAANVVDAYQGIAGMVVGGILGLLLGAWVCIRVITGFQRAKAR